MRSVPVLMQFSTALAAGLLVGFEAGRFAVCWPLAAAATALAACFGFGVAWRRWPLLVWLSLGVTLALSSEAVRRETLDASSRRSGPFSCEVEVAAATGERSFHARWRGVDLSVILSREMEGPCPSAGDVWRVAGWLERKPPADRTRRRLWVTGRLASAVRLRSGAAGWRGALAAVRADFSRRVGIGLDGAPEVADLTRAILLGERRRLDPSLRRIFTDAGTVHVFAVSGLHVGVIAMGVFYLLILCAVPVRWAGLFAIPAVWAYALMIGAPPSAVRAAAMATLGFLAPAVGRRTDLLSAWALVFLATHLLRPDWIVTVGSSLSFAVMLALVLWGRVFSCGYSVAAWAGGVPIVARVFGTFTPAGLLANLALLPAATVAVGVGAAGVAASYLSTALASYFNNASALFVRAMVAVSGAVSALPGASVAVPPWGAWECVGWYGAWALALWLAAHVRERRRREVWRTA